MEDPFRCAEALFKQRMSTYTPTGKTILDEEQRVKMGSYGECMFQWDMSKAGFDRFLLHWNKEWTEEKDHDDGVDFEIPVGTVDVKTTFKGDLYVNPKARRADIYVVYKYNDLGNAPAVKFVGWLWGWDLMNKGKMQYNNGMESVKVPGDRLNGDLRDLIDECEWTVEGGRP